ncbi:MAG: Succinyl-CoA ligase (ADP-forming) subunit alpha [Firmicutes bacterium ADurb.Bin153]|nr:MAG: Succinyl-CoA ligase (ADP-forming) subunit alpha [Firmicutes bacterium ADurb.Bin153]
MGILAGSSTRVVVQGITGREGSFHALRMRAYGTRVVAGVTPGKGGSGIDGIKVYDTVYEAMEAEGADASCIFAPAGSGADAIAECIHDGMPLIVCITEGIPQMAVLKVLAEGERAGWRGRLVGPNGPGLVTVGEALIGISPAGIFSKGRVGLVSRSGTLTYEIVDMLTKAGIGQTTCIGVGGDPIIGTTFTDCLRLFEDDPGTEAVVLIGEIGGSDEENAAKYLSGAPHKGVVAFISGRNAPAGKKMGHAGAIIYGRTGSAQAKMEALKDAGVAVVNKLWEIPQALRRLGV